MFEINKRNQKRIVELIIKIIDINIFRVEYYNSNKESQILIQKVFEENENKMKLYLNEVAERLETESNNYKQPLETLIEYLYNKHKILFPINLEDMISAKRELKLWLLM